MLERPGPEHGVSLRESLSPREQQLLEFAASGLTDQAIANNLGISLATVGTYWGRVRIKFGPYNRTELVALYLKEEATSAIEKLRDENRHLLGQIEEQAKVTQMLQTSLELFRGLVETAPDGILLVGGHGEIEMANQQAEEMFGYKKDGLLGLPVEKLIPERYRDQHRENRNEYNENPRKRRMGEHVATVALRKNGEEFPIAAALSATKTQGGILVTCILRDLSDRP
jgi:PAS domain S-box-containing protein